MKYLILVVSILFSLQAFSATQEVKFKTKDLVISGKFPFNPKSPLTINGADNSGKPYKFVVTTKAQGKNFYHVTFQLSYLGEKQEGSVATEVGHKARIEIGETGSKEPEHKFIVRIKE